MSLVNYKYNLKICDQPNININKITVFSFGEEAKQECVLRSNPVQTLLFPIFEHWKHTGI
jgi:hypothetical protein